jgi:pimeloyl-ACP methyl ester carboxylesterase
MTVRLGDAGDPAQSWQLPQTYASRIGSVRWAQLGDSSAASLVFLHGTPFSSFIWRDIARALARDHCVYVWDMPGYGASDKYKDQDLSLDALVEVFTELLGRWDLGEPTVIAHDTGGAVALGAHLRRGARYSRLGLVDAVSLAPWGSPFFQLVGEHAALFDNLPARLHQALLREYVNTASSPGLHPATLESLIAPWTDNAGQTAFYHQLQQRTADAGFVETIQDDYQTIDIPVAICWGEDDTWIPPARGRELADLIPAASFRIIPRAGHLAQEDNPAELTAALLTFLSNQSPD